MVNLYGPEPQDMKPGEIYRVVEDKEHGGIRLEKFESVKGQIVVLDLPAKVAYLFKVYAAILDNTLEGKILESLEDLAEELDDGHVLGEEIGAVCDKLYLKEEEQAKT